MKVESTGTRGPDVEADALAVPVAPAVALTGDAAEVDAALDGAISELARTHEHRGEFGAVHPIHTFGRIAARRVLVYGLGDAGALDSQRLRHAHHALARAAGGLGYRRLALLRADPLRPGDLAGAVEGAIMGAWSGRSHRSEPPDPGVEELVLAGYGEDRGEDLRAAELAGLAANRARDWTNAPANEMTPARLADVGAEIAALRGSAFEVLGPDELAAGGYRLLLGVASGSAQPARMFRVHHRGSVGGPRLALIGKGITFDSGGLSLKNDQQMRQMKDDMAGAAAVLAAIDAIAARELPVDVMAVVASTENMTGPAAQRPGDVWTSASGKTVEVLNTDAEGRLVLADALTYAIRAGATHVVDLATLTGAATVALGHAATAAVAGDDELWAMVATAAEKSGERVHRFPIYPEHRPVLDSQVADLRNSYYGEAGMILGGLFIGQFAEGRPWVHLDIAASSWNSNPDLPAVPSGPLGTGARLCIALAELMATGNR